MEPLFKLDAENIDFMLADVRRKLMMMDESSQVSCIEQMRHLLESEDAVGREAVFLKLVKSDVLSTMFELLQTSKDRLLRSILDFLNTIIVYQKFYESYIAQDAMNAILKVAVCILKSRTKETQSLEKLVAVMNDILFRSVKFNVDIGMICHPRQILTFLKSLISENPMDQKIQFSGVELLSLVLSNIDTKEEVDDDAYELIHEALNLMEDIVAYSDDEISISVAADALCGLCASATRLCVSENPSQTEVEVFAPKPKLSKAIRDATMNTLIPYAKNREESNDMDRVKFPRNLVTCLNNLYKLSGGCDHDLSNKLTANGYLKYFLLLTTTFPKLLRRSSCLLLSRILTTLAYKSTPIDRPDEQKTAFGDSMYRGLLDLPSETKYWGDVIARRNNSNALATLIYYHYLGTRETDMIQLESLIARIVNLPKSEHAQVLKVLWFLFALASVSHRSPSTEQDYYRAVKRLAAALRRSTLHDCYTHHIDLLRYCLESVDFPKDLRNATMNLWLIESDGDIKPLLTLDCREVVQHYLLLVIREGYSEEIINLAMKGIREMIRMNNAKELAEIAWDILPKLMSMNDPSKDEQMKAVLELTNVSTPASLTSSVRNRCADGLLAIIVRQEADLKLRTLAIMQSYALLVTSVGIQSFTILEKCCSTPDLLKELVVQGFSTKTTELSAVCLKLLAFIVRWQKKSSIQVCEDIARSANNRLSSDQQFIRRVDPMPIDVQSLADLLLNTRRSVHSSINAIQLVLELFTQNIDGSLIRLNGFDKEHVEDVINLYETLFIVHEIRDPSQRDTIYKCLQAFQQFCCHHVEWLMYHLCTLMSVCDIVCSVLETRYVSSDFLEYVATWLGHRKRYCADEAPWNERSLRKTPFEETLDLIRSYVKGVKASKTSAGFSSLLQALSQYED